jgi:hypothetical protein
MRRFISLKNHYGSIDNPFKLHANGCNPHIADVNMAEAIRKKTKLIVCDATRPQYGSGSSREADYEWYFGGILISTDPVALDTIGAGILGDKRNAARPPRWALDPEPAHIRTAAHYGLGLSDTSRIDRINVFI